MSLFFEDFEVQELRDELMVLLRTGNYSIGGMAKKINLHRTTLEKFLSGNAVVLQNMIKIKNWLETEETK